MRNLIWGKIAVIVLVIFMLPLSGYTENIKNKYIGMKYRECPAGLTDEGGAIIDEELKYAIAFYLKDSTHMLWLEKIYQHDKNGNPSFEVLDVIVSPIKDKRYVFSRFCSVNDEERQNIVVLVKNEEKEWLTDIKYAWEIDLKKRKFVETSIKGIKCFNESMIAE